MQLRTATCNDAKAISQLLISSANTFFADDFSDAGLARFKADFTENRVNERICANEFRYYVADIGGQLAGVCAIRGDSHLYNLFTAAQFQRRGVAKALWQHAMQFMAETGVDEATVNASNYAVSAYERLGFVRTGVTQCVDGIVFNPMVIKFSSG